MKLTENKRTYLPYGHQEIDESDIDSVIQVLNEEFLTTGPKVDEFENDFAEIVGSKYAIACSSGTAALHLACCALGLGEGDRVLVPSITFVSTANAVRFVNADVDFVDCDARTGLINIASLIQHLEIHSNIKAIIVVHLNGQVAPMEEITRIAQKYNVKIIEDACHALGTTYMNSSKQKIPIGSCEFCSLSVFSFHPVKAITTGEGGMVTTNDPELAEQLKTIKNHGIVRDTKKFINKEQAFNNSGKAKPWYYEMQYLGFNYRISDINCALGINQLRKLDMFVAKRKKLMLYYDSLINDLTPIITPIERVPNTEPALHLYPVLIDFDKIKLDKVDIVEKLAAQGIGTQVHYYPVHRQQYYENIYGTKELPGADLYYKNILSLPFFVRMCEKDIDTVVSSLKEVVM